MHIKKTWPEMQSYWEWHYGRHVALDYQRDPEGLAVVCEASATLFLNRFYAHFQQKVYTKLLSLVPPPTSGARALDVGCGAGRWCKFLAARGYQTTGIDLQAGLIQANRQRYPQCEFACSAIQDYDSIEPFDLISSVTVLQHVPFEEQSRAIQNLRKLVRAGGFAVALENVRDQGPHVFANSIGQWCERFRQAGFALVALRRYDYNPFLRVLRWIWLSTGAARTLGPSDSSDVVREPARGRKTLRTRIKHVGEILAAVADSGVETLLVGGNFSLPSRHCGFLFRAG